MKEHEKVNLEKNAGLNGIRTHDRCDSGAVLLTSLPSELSSQLGAGHFGSS